MKLLNVLSVSVFGVLFAVGCSSTDTTSTDGGATDSGSTSETATDSGTAEETTPSDTGSETSSTACNDCVNSKCASEKSACAASTDCQAVLKCIVDCGTDDTCANACISVDTKPGVKEANDLISCGQTNCATECM